MGGGVFDCKAANFEPPVMTVQFETPLQSHFRLRVLVSPTLIGGKIEIFPDSFMFDRQGFELHLSDSLNKVYGTQSNVPLHKQLD